MERRFHHLALLLGLLAWAAAAAATTCTGAEALPVCMPTAPFCEPINACRCRVAAQPQLVLARCRLNATHHLFALCRGQRTGGAHLAAACQGPSSPAATVPVIAHRHNQLTREAISTAPTTPTPPPHSGSGSNENPILVGVVLLGIVATVVVIFG